MSQSESDTPFSPFSPGRGRAAISLLQFPPGQGGPFELDAIQGLVEFNAALHDLEIADAKADADANNEQEAFLALPPSNDAFDNDNVFSVGAESQFSDSTPRAAGANLRQELMSLCALRDSLSSKILENGDEFFEELQQYMIEQAPGIQVYGNQSIVARLGQNMLVPMLSFYGIATKETIAAGIKPKIGDIKTKIHELTCSQFTTPSRFTPALFPDSAVDCTMPTAANLCWNVRLTLHRNIFTLLTFRVVAMDNLVFQPQIPGVTHKCFNAYLLDASKRVDPTPNATAMTLLLQGLGVSVASQDGMNMYHFPHKLQYLDDTQHEHILALLTPEVGQEFARRLRITSQNYCLHLLFALLSKACAKDFNCLCSMPEIDDALFKVIVGFPPNIGSLNPLIQIITTFLKNLAEPQLDSKQSYMLTALHNLVSSFDTSKTGETLAYKYLFDGETPGSGANTFNPIMAQINKVIRMLRGASVGREELQVSLCGGRMIYKLGDVLRGYVGTRRVAAAQGVAAEFLFAEMVKPLSLPSDSDYTYSIAGVSNEDLDFVQTRLMFYTFCSQLGIKKIIDDFCTSHPQYAALFLRERAVIGMSLVGGDFQLSSSRNSCDALAFLDMINIGGNAVPPLLIDFLKHFRDPKRLPKSSLAPCDLVPKMPSGNYIKKIAGYIFSSDYVPAVLQGVMDQIALHIDAIAARISRYSMSTDEGFSSPVKVLFDIFFTLFSIENVTNRAFVTQKINKELKRIAICASILFFHFNELLPGYAVETEQHRQITAMLQTLAQIINYGYNPAVKLLSPEIDTIMTAYASCFVRLLHLYYLGVVFYSRVPGVTLPPIGDRGVLFSLETSCMNMLTVQAQELDPYRCEGLTDEALRTILTTGLQFLATIQENGILQNFLQLKQKVKTKDSEYKAEGRFLTSVEAFECFLQGFPEIGHPSPEPALPALSGFVTILTHPTLLNDLQPLLVIFHSNAAFAELMHFQPIVVIKSENLTVEAQAIPANAEGLKVSGQHQFGIYALLSIFGVKFKSEWSKIALFTRMLFRELFSRGMNDACQRLLGVSLGNIHPAKYRTSHDNYQKDVILFEALQRHEIDIDRLPSLSTYYGRGNVRHGVNVYFNPVTAAKNFQFIFPDNPQPNDELLSFRFLSPEILQLLGVDAFGQLLAQGALQPRAYEFLVDRLLQKFSNLTKECDEKVTKELKDIGHGGRPSKDIKVQRKLGEVDAFIQSLLPLSQQSNGSDQFIHLLMASSLSACFEGKKDEDKFLMLSDDQRMLWLEHLTSMIRFLITYPNTDPIHQRLVKYSKLLLLLKKYIPPQATMQQAAMQQAAIQEAARQAAAIEEAARQAAAIEEAARQASRQAAPASDMSLLHKKGDKGDKPKSSVTKPPPPNPSNPPTPTPVKGKPQSKGPGGFARRGGTIRTSNPHSPKKTNNHTRKNKYKRNNKNKNKKHKSSPKYKKRIPSSRSGSQSNRKKSKSKLPHKNVTFKRRRARK